MTLRSLTLAVALATTLLACGGEPTAGGSPEASASTDPDDAMLAFADCMREHGIDVPDPGPDGNLTLGREVGGDSDIDPESGDFQEAEEACSHLLEGALSQIERPDPEEQAEMQERLLAFARCMRDHGIDFPDPQFRDGMAVIGPPEGSEFDPEDPDVVAAQAACEELLPELAPGEGEQ